MPHLTFRPHVKRRYRRHGFRRRMRTADGRNVIARRRRQGRKKLSVSSEYRWK